MKRVTNRLDNFTDAAFAFALSLLVIGRSEIPTSSAALTAAMANLPIFGIGFAMIGMFWYGHVRWREYRGEGGLLSVALTFALVFILLIYVPPLQAMAASLATYLGGQGTRFTGNLGTLFAIYGAGFTAMSALLGLLFWEARRHAAPGSGQRAGLTGEIAIWTILAATGTVSTLLSLSRATAWLGPFAYATLPLTIGLFAARYPWPKETVSAPSPAAQ